MSKVKTKSKLAAIFSLSFALSFMVFLFVPIDLYLHNPTDIFVGLSFFLPTLFVSFMAMFIGIAAVLILLMYQKLLLGVAVFVTAVLPLTVARFAFCQFVQTYNYLLIALIASLLIWILLLLISKERAIDIALHLLFGILLVSYVQILFLNYRMTTITGDWASYNTFTAPNVINIMIWVVFIAIPPCAALMFHKKKGFISDKLLIFSSALVVAMQLSGLLSVAITEKIPRDSGGVFTLFSYEPIVKFSADQNILVFVLDRLDVKYMTETLQEYPELYEQLDGFTFYKDNVSEFGMTFPSLTTMLTGHYLKNGMTVNSYWSEAWSQYTMIDMLKENGFTTNLLLDKLSTYGSFSEIKDRAENAISTTISVNHKGMLNIFIRLSLGRLSPYYAKNLFLGKLDSAFGNGFLKTNDANKQPLVVGTDSDIRFYEYIKNNTFDSSCGNKVFNFIHLNCSHADVDKRIVALGYHFDKESNVIKSGGNYIDSTRACFEILNVYFSKMKEIGVYDNTTIILLGDHGAFFPTTTGLLIKPQNSKGSLKIDDTASFSNKYLGASVLDAANLDYSGFGESYFNLLERRKYPTRYFYKTSGRWWLDNSVVMLVGTYVINGDANDPNNWIFVEDEIE